MKRILAFVLVLLGSLLCAQTAPVISNVNIIQRTDGSMIVDIWYDLEDANGDLCLVTFKFSSDGGQTYDHFPSFGNLSGAVGYNQSPGMGKHIEWSTENEGLRLDGNQYRIRLTADDGSSPSLPQNFVFVPGGTCFNGVGNVTVSDFYIDKYEVTQESYQQIMGYLPSDNNGVGPLFPVYWVTWFDAVEYCNSRSIEENISPCYSYLDYGTNPQNWPAGWKNDYYNHTFISCNWSANGYRLPTVAEWTFAAKGGNYSMGFSYSGSNIIDMVAWYDQNSDGTTQWVGIKSANELGLHDMTGNVWEWCWDIHAALPSEPQTNPHGPVSGSCRVTRGASYSTAITYCPVDFHNNGGHADSYRYNVGFRLVRISP